MEASLQIYRPFGCRRLFLEGTRWKIKPSHVSVYSRGCPGSKYPCHILATSDSSRKRQRKTSKPKSASPKGYSRSSLSKSSGSTDTNQKDQVDETSTKFDSTYSSESKDLRAETVLQTSEEHFPAHHEEIHNLKDDVTGEEDALVSPETRGIDYSFARHVLQEVPDSNTEADLPEYAVASDASENDISREAIMDVQKLASFLSESQIEDRDKEWNYTKSEKDELLKSSSPNDISVRMEEIEKLALQKSLSGIKVFIYPDVAKAGHDIEIFLNRSASTLKEQPIIQMMGAFNEWRWKSFTQSLRRTELQGDWWSCSVHVPKETYQLDFVFFDGDTIYENNDSKDFFVSVTSGMDRSSFEDYLLEEKRHELERLAAEQAEKEREAAEKRQLEEKRLASEEDKAQARVQAEARRAKFNETIHRTFKSDDNLWYIEPLRFKGGDTVRLYYNRSHRPLATASEVWVHGGYNNWQDGLSMKTRLVPGNETNGDWWSADIMVPDRALVLDWVFADGPPETAKVYDNNNSHDFHAPVPERIPEDLYWAEEEHHIYMKLQHVRKLREEAKRLKAEKTAWMKWEMKEKTRKRFLQSQKHVVYTDPLDVRAGEFVTVFYNPTNTVLSGSGEIWFRCSFNRWTHRNGPVQPQRMVPVESSPHMKATVKVPLDTFSMDFVFSNSLDGGTYDNKDGIDYHLPVIGGIAREPPMHIVHIAVEMAPIAKVGGLGDVVTSLSRAVQDLGHNVEIILPKYDCLDLSKVNDMQFVREYGWGGTQIKVWLGKVAGLSVYFLEPQNGMFWVKCIYGCKNDGERFGFFCHAALEFLLQSGSHPDILHCHDWSSAPVSWLYKENYQHYGLSSARVVFTIHNLEFGANLIGKAMAFADKATTVSPTYSKEVSGNPCIAPYLYKFHGIINGIDPDIWDPYNDHFIPVPYTSDNAIEGKRAAKEALQQRLGLRRSDCPLVGIISRLTAQKGINLIKHAIWRTLDRGGQVVLLGSAPDPKIQNDFAILAHEVRNSHSDWGRLVLTYDEPLSHLIYAGADFILVPSLFEPCGLTQLVAMRYGAVPVVRRTGGLNDTVFDVDHDRERAERQGVEPNGFSFDVADSAGVDYALNRAISSWYDAREFFNSMCKGVMEQDWSWNRPALDYMELYYAARKD